jgi:hypothetical protein
MNHEWKYTPKEQEVLDRCLPHLEEEQTEMLYEEAFEWGSKDVFAEDAYAEALPVMAEAIERNLRERRDARKNAASRRTKK